MAAARIRRRIVRAAREFRQSLLFFPILLSVAAVLLFLTTDALDRTFGGDIPRHVPFLAPLIFTGTPGAAQSVLSSVATMWASITGVVFSVTLVTITLSATKYTAQVVPTFERDRLNQVVLGTYVGTVVYSLLVLKTIRIPTTDSGFAPIIGTNVAIVLAILSLFLLVLFIQNLTNYIQPKNFVDDLSKQIRETSRDVLAPEGIPGFALVEDARLEQPPLPEGEWTTLCTNEEGYLQAVRWEELQTCLGAILAKRGASAGGAAQEARFEVVVSIGDRLSEGDPLAILQLPGVTLTEDDLDALRVAFLLQAKRTIEGDPAFGLESLGDIGLTAMSGGSTDVGVSLACMRELFAIAKHFAAIPDPGTTLLMTAGGAQVTVVRMPTDLLGSLLHEARRNHDKAIKEGFWDVLEVEILGSAGLLEACAIHSDASRFDLVFSWFGWVLPDAFRTTRDPGALTRMARRLGSAVSKLRREEDADHARRLEGLVRHAFGQQEDPPLREKLAGAFEAGLSELGAATPNV